MPESVTDRPASSVEMMFLLSKAGRYHFDMDAIAVKAAEASLNRWDHNIDDQQGSFRANGGEKTNGAMKAVRRGGGAGFGKQNADATGTGAQSRQYDRPAYENRSRRNGDWWFESWQGLYVEHKQLLGLVANPVSYKGAHFATYPPALIEPCILATSRPGDTVIDPFNGSGTTGSVCMKWGRKYVGVDLNAEYLDLSKDRFRQGVLFPVP